MTVPKGARPGQVTGSPLRPAPGWASGTASPIRGNGERAAEAFEGGKPAVLHIEYQIR